MGAFVSCCKCDLFSTLLMVIRVYSAPRRSDLTYRYYIVQRLHYVTFAYRATAIVAVSIKTISAEYSTKFSA